tara:strand:- start:1276 stop:1881 length:606 start_codon:yes stop_codon:yes gene_type:complete
MNDMTKVKNITFIGSYHNIASDDYCDRMIAKFEKIANDSSLIQKSGNYGSEQYGAKKRKDLSIFFHEAHNDAVELHQETNKILDQALKLYMEDYPSLGTCHNFYSNICKVQKTPPKGGFHQWHCERGWAEYGSRCLTWTIYLNDIPEGEGETEFLEYGIKVQPKKGMICFFPSDWTHTHRGNAVYTHNKYIATGWYYIAQQ